MNLGKRVMREWWKSGETGSESCERVVGRLMKHGKRVVRERWESCEKVLMEL